MLHHVPENRTIRLVVPCLLLAASFAATISPASGRQPPATSRPPADAAGARPAVGMPKVPPLPKARRRN